MKDKSFGFDGKQMATNLVLFIYCISFYYKTTVGIHLLLKFKFYL